MKTPSATARWLCTAGAAALLAIGALAIKEETHTGNARFMGQVTLMGEQAVGMGLVICVLGLLPLIVWVQPRFVRGALILWWLGLMGLIGAIVLMA
ncbi:MAG: hypothetical protein KGZ46_12280 [Hydrogenophaga sp.]|nr:hypothetical protein [Hydrogenophaga sp.]